MKKMKRICALALAGMMAASVAACGSKNEGSSGSGGTNRVRGTIEDVPMDVSNKGGSYSLKIYDVTVSDGQMNFTFDDRTGRLAAIIIRKVQEASTGAVAVKNVIMDKSELTFDRSEDNFCNSRSRKCG